MDSVRQSVSQRRQAPEKQRENTNKYSNNNKPVELQETKVSTEWAIKNRPLHVS